MSTYTRVVQKKEKFSNSTSPQLFSFSGPYKFALQKNFFKIPIFKPRAKRLKFQSNLRKNGESPKSKVRIFDVFSADKITH